MARNQPGNQQGNNNNNNNNTPNTDPPKEDKPLADVPTPNLNDSLTWVPPMTGNPWGQKPPDPNAKPPDTPPVVKAFTVSPGSLEAAAIAILRSAHDAVGAYDAARNYLNANKSWIFDVANADVPNRYGQWVPSYVRNGRPYQITDPHPEWTQQWTAAADNVLLAAADVIRLAGDYLSAVDNAGQFYTQADKKSVMPELQ